MRKMRFVLAGTLLASIMGVGLATSLPKASVAEAVVAVANDQETPLPAPVAPDELPKWDGTVGTAFESGTGTEEDPYIIKTGEQLTYLRSLVNGGATQEGLYFELGADINLNNTLWTAPIGKYSSTAANNLAFSGKFDGKDHIIYNFKIEAPTSQNFGLFGSVRGTGSYVKNLKVTGAVNVKDRYGLIRDLNSTVSNIVSWVNITTNANTAGTNIGWVGGIVSATTSGSTTAIVEDCVNYGSIDIQMEQSTNGQVGGIIGAAGYGTNGSAIVRRCKNFGTLSGIDKAKKSGVYSGGYVAGISGYLGKGSVENCINYGAADVEIPYCAGIVGHCGAGTVQNNVNYGNITSLMKNAAGILGRGSGSTVKNNTNYGDLNVTYAGLMNSSAIVGELTNATKVSDCHNHGDFHAYSGTGQYGIFTGYVGVGSDFDFETCTNDGTFYMGDVEQIVYCNKNNNFMVNKYHKSTLVGAATVLDGETYVPNDVNVSVTGRTLNGWYTDEALTTPYTSSAITWVGGGSLNIYGRFGLPKADVIELAEDTDSCSVDVAEDLAILKEEIANLTDADQADVLDHSFTDKGGYVTTVAQKIAAMEARANPDVDKNSVAIGMASASFAIPMVIVFAGITVTAALLLKRKKSVR